MNEKLEIEIQYTVEDYTRANEFILNQTFFFKYVHYFVGIPVLLIVLVLIPYLGGKFSDGISFGRDILPILIAGGIVLALLPFIMRLVSRLPNPGMKLIISSQYKSSPLLQEKQFVTFEDEGIRAKTSLSEGLTKWEAILKIIETEKDFFFFISNRSALFIPKNELVPQVHDQIRLFSRVKHGDKASLLHNTHI
ncbi:MAG: YcxB family protein [Pyrinomonadaceae bacterium]|nr:YcxB family protein [Pyrinomonadaceae bacterium]